MQGKIRYLYGTPVLLLPRPSYSIACTVHMYHPTHFGRPARYSAMAPSPVRGRYPSGTPIPAGAAGASDSSWPSPFCRTKK